MYNSPYCAEFDHEQYRWIDCQVPVPGEGDCFSCGRSTDFDTLGDNYDCLHCSRIMFSDYFDLEGRLLACEKADAFGAAQTLLKTCGKNERRYINWSCPWVCKALARPEFVQAWAERLPADYASEPNFPQHLRERPEVALGFISAHLDYTDSGHLNYDMMKYVPQALHRDTSILVPAFGAMDYKAYDTVHGWETNVELAAALFDDRLEQNRHFDKYLSLAVKIKFFNKTPLWFRLEKVGGISRADRVIGEAYNFFADSAGQPPCEWLNLGTREEMLHAMDTKIGRVFGNGDTERDALDAAYEPFNNNALDLSELKRTNPFVKAFLRACEPRGKQLWYKLQTWWAHRCWAATLDEHFAKRDYHPSAGILKRDRDAFDNGGIDALPAKRGM